MRERILAKRYAKALLDLGQEEKALERLLEDVRRLDRAFKQEPILPKYLSLREVRLEKKREILKSLSETLLLSPWTQSLLGLMLGRSRIHLFPLVVQIFGELALEAENKVVARIKAAERKSVEGIQDSLKKALEKLTGKRIELEIEENPNLIGGLKVCIGDTIYDSSLAGELERIKEKWI